MEHEFNVSFDDGVVLISQGDQTVKLGPIGIRNFAAMMGRAFREGLMAGLPEVPDTRVVYNQATLDNPRTDQAFDPPKTGAAILVRWEPLGWMAIDLSPEDCSRWSAWLGGRPPGLPPRESLN